MTPRIRVVCAARRRRRSRRAAAVKHLRTIGGGFAVVKAGTVLADPPSRSSA